MLTGTNGVLKKIQRTANKLHCPECGSLMILVDWRNESETLFIWYSCSRNGCNGQWLKRIDASSSDIEKVA